MSIHPSINLQNALKIDGWMSNSELKWLAERALLSKVIVEIGCMKGRSTRALCDNTTGCVYAVDKWNGPYLTNNQTILWEDCGIFYPLFLENTRYCDNLFICRGDLEEFIKNIPPADFVFIDGDHRYESVCKDINNVRKILKPGGILSGHDYTHHDWPGVKKAVDELVGKINLLNSIWWKVNE